MTNPPTPPIVAAIFVNPLDEEFLAEAVAVVVMDDVGKEEIGTAGLPLGGRGIGAVNPVVETLAVGEDGTFRAKSGG